MKLLTIILLSFLSFSCDKNLKSNSEKSIALNELNTELNIQQPKIPELIGKWYSSYLSFDNKKFIRKEKT